MDDSFEQQFLRSVKASANQPSGSSPKRKPFTASHSPSTFTPGPFTSPGSSVSPDPVAPTSPLTSTTSPISASGPSPVSPISTLSSAEDPSISPVAAVASASSHSSGTGSRLPLLIATILAVVVVIESIALIITLSNYFAITSDNYGVSTIPASDAEQQISEITYSNAYTYNDSDNLIAFALTCTAQDGAKYIFTQSNTFKQQDSSSNITSQGNYTIVNDKYVQIPATDGTKVLYYDDTTIADGTKLYQCIEDEPSGSNS